MSVQLNLSIVTTPSADISAVSSLPAAVKTMAPPGLTPLDVPRASTDSAATSMISSAEVALPAALSPVSERRCHYFGELQGQLLQRLRQPDSALPEPTGDGRVSPSMRADCIAALTARLGQDVADPAPGR